LLAALRWDVTLDPWAPRVIAPGDHVALEYGLDSAAGAGADEERIQDLLRQDEAARRSSSCAD
jgi:hypothetical protein